MFFVGAFIFVLILLGYAFLCLMYSARYLKSYNKIVNLKGYDTELSSFVGWFINLLKKDK
jgi:hypothetical protein